MATSPEQKKRALAAFASGRRYPAPLPTKEQGTNYLRSSASLPALGRVSSTTLATSPQRFAQASLVAPYNDTSATALGLAPYPPSFPTSPARSPAFAKTRLSTLRPQPVRCMSFHSTLVQCEMQLRETLSSTSDAAPSRARADACLAALREMAACADDSVFAGLLPLVADELQLLIATAPGVAAAAAVAGRLPDAPSRVLLGSAVNGEYFFESSDRFENELVGSREIVAALTGVLQLL